MLILAPGVLGGWPMGVCSQPPESELHAVGFTHHRSKLGLQGSNQRPFSLPAFRQGSRTTGVGGKTRHPEHVLYRYRYTHQRPGGTTGSPDLISGAGKFQCRLGAPADIGSVITVLAGFYRGFNQRLRCHVPGSEPISKIAQWHRQQLFPGHWDYRIQPNPDSIWPALFIPLLNIR